MNITNEEIHSLSAAAARITAITNILRDAEFRKQFAAEDLGRDLVGALRDMERIWNDCSQTNRD